MKLLYSFVTAALILRVAVLPAQAAPNISVDFFYDQLGDYGDWSEVGDYGYGWQPRDVDANWRPYSDGRWAYTDAGWTWMSDEPYGWAVYHYGRWAQIEQRGWVWIPGTEWAPAWVSWRRSPRHVGWAPLPPEATFRRNIGFSGWVDSYYDIGPSAYRFVETRNFGAPRLRTVFVEPRENITIIRQTTNITRMTYVNNVVNNGGPAYEDISRESAEPVRRLRLDRRMEVEGGRDRFRGEQMRSRVDGDSLRVFAPGFDARAGARPQKLAAKIEKVEINRGWKDAGPPADVEKLRAKVRGEAKVPKGLPSQPKFERLAEQTTLPDGLPTKEAASTTAPGETPRGEKTKDGRGGKELPIPPVVPAAPPRVAPSRNANAVAPEAPVNRQRPPQRTGKPTGAEAPAQQPARPAKAEAQPKRITPPPTKPTNLARDDRNRKQQGSPLPSKVESGEPIVKAQRQEAQRKLPPAPAQREPKKEGAFPPGSAPRREPPVTRKEEPQKAKTARPESARQAPPAVEKARPQPGRANPAKVSPGKAPEPAPRGKAPKANPGKGKAEDEKNAEDEARKPQ